MISKQSDDVQVEVCKVFYLQKEKVQAMFVFKIGCDEGLTLEQTSLQVGKESFSGSQIVVIKDFKDLSECHLSKLSLSYVLEGEEDEVELEDVEVRTYDMVSDEQIDKYAELFEQFESNP